MIAWNVGDRNVGTGPGYFMGTGAVYDDAGRGYLGEQENGRICVSCGIKHRI